MAYDITLANDANNVAEREYAKAAEVCFTQFTSCIGILARDGQVVTGIHLSVFSQDDTLFNVPAAGKAVALIGNYQEVKVIGLADVWEDSFAAFKAQTGVILTAYHYLLHLLKNPEIIQRDDGIYGARIRNGHIETFTRVAL